MATAKSRHNEQAEAWFDNSKQYWDGWFEAQRKAMDEQVKKFSGLQGQWGQFFTQWQNMLGGRETQPGADAFRLFFVKAGESYINMMEQFYQAAGQSRAPEDATKDWLSAMQKFFETSLMSVSQPSDPAAFYKNTMESMTNAGPAFWTTAFKNPFLGQKWDHNPTGYLFDPFGFYASLPGIGYTREKQEHFNKLYRQFIEYEGAMRRYNSEMIKVGLQALHEFQNYLKRPPEESPPLTSLKEIYVKWVDVCEEVYAEYALSDEYTQMYGEVVNALMAFKKQLHIIADDTFEQLNLPTRAEVDSLHKRVHELRRENIELRKDLNALTGKPKASSPKSAATSGKKGKKK